MRKASKKEEMAAIEYGLGASSTPVILKRMILSYCMSRKIIPVEINKFCKKHQKILKNNFQLLRNYHNQCTN